MRALRFSTFLGLAFSGLVAAFSAGAADPIRLCVGIGEWAPYSYVPIVDGKRVTDQWKGFSVELFDEIFKIIGWEHSIGYVTWKRCLNEVDNFGKKGRFEVFFDGTYNKSRAEKYYFTAPIYTTHQGLFYSAAKYPDGPDVKSVADLKNFSICGVSGNNYDIYGLADSDIKTRAKRLNLALKMVAYDRCDLAVSSMEPVYGSKLTGESFIPDGVVGKPIPGMLPTKFYIFVAKTSPRAYELLTKINQALATLQNNGVSDRILAKYLSEIGIK